MLRPTVRKEMTITVKNVTMRSKFKIKRPAMMNKPIRVAEAGVTLLEILLVLAISVSITLMSVRYYSSATYSMQTNQTLTQIQAITAAIDNYAAGLSYAGISPGQVRAVLPSFSTKTAWGESIAIEHFTNYSYDVTLPNLPSSVCPLLVSKLTTNNHYKIRSDCGDTSKDLTYTYVLNA